jgi:hypothetical protein
MMLLAGGAITGVVGERCYGWNKGEIDEGLLYSPLALERNEPQTQDEKDKGQRALAAIFDQIIYQKWSEIFYFLGAACILLCLVVIAARLTSHLGVQGTAANTPVQPRRQPHADR